MPDLSAPSLDTRGGMPRPRRGVVASTGQIPVARRAPAPADTTPVPLVTPERWTQPPSRLRTEPPVVTAPIPAVPQALVAPLRPAPPVPPAAPTAPVRRARRRPTRAAVSALAVLGLLAVSGIPAFAVVARDPGAPQAFDGDEQDYRVGADIDPAQASLGGERGLAPASVDAGVAVLRWVRPVVGELGDPFGPRPIQPVPGVSLFHRGQDIVAGCGSTVSAAAAGTVEYAGWDGTYGNWILVDHGGGIATGYAHEEQLLVSVGQHVTAGQPIGLVGETGAATGCHLHFEVHVNGIAVNPVPFMTAHGVSLGG